MRHKDYYPAITSLNKSINLKPTSTNCFVQRAEAYLQLCDYQSAILNYKRACVLDPENFTHYCRLAFIYFFQGQCLFDQKLYPEALEAFSRAAEMRPEVIGYHTRRYMHNLAASLPFLTFFSTFCYFFNFNFNV